MESKVRLSEKTLCVALLFQQKNITCEAREKLGPGDRFLLLSPPPALPGPPPAELLPAAPFRFRRFFAGLDVSANEKKNPIG